MDRQAGEDRHDRLALAAIVVLAVALRLFVYNPWDQFHADEFYQYLEQAHRMVEGYGLVTWEGRYGVRNALIPQFLAAPFALGVAIAPGGMLPIELARLSFAALCLAALAGAWGIGRASSRRHALVALLVAAVWYDGVALSVQLLSESLATAILVCGAALLLIEQPKRSQLVLAGFLLTLGVLVRLQYAPFAAALVLLTARGDWRMWRDLAIGGSMALLLGAASDLANHQIPFRWIVVNFTMNIGDGRAAQFGVTGPFEYGRLLLAGLGPFSPVILAVALLAGPRYRALIVAALVNILVHSLIGHKEYRFIWLSVFLILVLAAIATVDLLDRWIAQRKPGQLAGPRALALLCLGWMAASLAAQATIGSVTAYRSGGAYTQAAHDVSGQPGICGLSVPLQWRNHVVTAYLRRDIPIYIAPEDVLKGKAAMPGEIARGANAMLGIRPLSPDYRQIACHRRKGQKACLFIRPGSCDKAAGKAYEYQTLLLKFDI